MSFRGTTTAAFLTVASLVVGACGGKTDRDFGTGGATVTGPQGPSCSGMSGTECNGESCCTSIVVPGGTFLMGPGTETCDGCTNGCPVGRRTCPPDEQPEHPETVSSFALDKYQVTVGRFRAFMEAFDEGWRPSAEQGANGAVELAQGLGAGATGWLSAWDVQLPTNRAELEDRATCKPNYETWTASAGANETYPINCVSWHEAFAFCIWDDGRLPTEAEWEYAAVGGDENRLFPWGNDPTEPLPANYRSNHNTPFLPVGSEPMGNGRWGHADLAGSRHEWVLDWHAEDWYTTVRTGCHDCANLGAASDRVQRGGCWDSFANVVRAAVRLRYEPGAHLDDFGFRCARSSS